MSVNDININKTLKIQIQSNINEAENCIVLGNFNGHVGSTKMGIIKRV